MRTIAAAVVAMFVAAPAFAADIPRPVYKGATYVAAPNWAGPYAGVNVGYGWGNTSSDFSVAIAGVAAVPFGSNSANPRGLIAGGQLGYNFQTGAFVYGIEGDLQYSAQRGDATAVCPAGVCGALAAAGVGIANTERINWFGTVRGRLGYDFGRMMPYVTGGLAVAGVRSELTATTAVGSAAFNNTQTRMGWTLGGGFESMINRSWSWKVEYLYMDLGRYSTDNSIAVGIVALPAVITQTRRTTDNIARVGLNYHF